MQCIKNNIFPCFFILTVITVFLFSQISLASSDLKITNVQYDGGSGKSDEDFVEIINNSSEDISLKGYRLAKKTSSEKRYTLKSWTSDTIIQSGEKYVWACSKNGFAQSIGANTSTSETISDENGIALILGSLEDGSIVDSINWKEENSEEEEEEEEEEDKKDYSKIIINEIYPAPDTKKDEEEFLEIKNLGDKEIDFSDWIIKDSKSAKGKISEIKKEGNFVVFYGSFSLNNDSKGDTIFLYDKKENLITSQNYSSGKSAYSYSYDGQKWRWTSTPTPLQENVFDKILSGRIKMDEKIYANAYANFEAISDNDAQKFTWNFGDDHKSYLKKTKHKYEKAGEYSASLKITGNGEDAFYEFTVKVEKYSAPKIRIVNLVPNPKGLDKNEFIVLQNKSKKKVNLKGWSIATGWKKLINHPIREKFEIKAGKSKKLTKKICAFTLVNTKDKIELRDPSGKTVQKIKYDHGEKSISEDGIYSKIDGDWEWIETPNSTEEKPSNSEKIENSNIPKPEQNDPEEINLDTSEEEIQASLGKYTISTAWQKKKDNRIKIAYSNSKIIALKIILTNQPRVLGIQKINMQENYYTFTTPENKIHWAIELFNNSLTKINSRLNKFFLLI